MIIASPDNNKRAELTYLSEIRFGPSYYKLELNGKELPNRIFGDAYLWSADSRYFAVQEWMTINYQEGPITRVVLFDVVNGLCAYFKVVVKGFVQDFNFENGKLIYKKHYYADGKIVEVEVDVSSIVNWNKY
jgi:hypothetical protein